MIYIKPLKSVCAVLVSCILFGCAKPEDSHHDAGSTPSISFPVNPVMVPSSGGNITAAVVCDDSWAAVSQSDWITSVEPASDNASVTFTVAANQAASPRDGKITFSFEGSSYTKDLTVRQAANLSTLTVSVTEVELSPEGEERDIVIVGEDWSVKSVSADWLEVKKKNSSAITVSAPINYSGSDLNAEIVIGDAAGNSETVSVSQKYGYELFKGASTVAGRKFVYKSSGLVTSVESDKSYRIDDNVSVLEICYEGEVMTGSVQPTALFVYEVNLNSDVTLKTTCAFDDNSSIKTDSLHLTQVQIMREQLMDLQDNHPEFTVLGGVNGDFFFGEHRNFLQGVVYRDGNCLKDTFDGGTTCTVFAIMDDGTARCMTQSVYSERKSSIVEAVGGRQQVLLNGSNVSNDDTLQPRTAVGVSSDGRTVWFIVVDGRRPKWSNGASFPMMAKMFTALGAYNAINLDGGGSSTFVTSENGVFNTVNKVADPTGERRVVNGIAIVKNK